MAVDENLTGYSRTATNNTPAGSDSIGTDLDNHLRDMKKNVLYASQRPAVEKSADYSATLADHTRLLLVDASAGSVTVTLPAVATAGDGYRLGIKKIDPGTNTAVVNGDASETIDGTVSYSLRAQYDVTELVCDGSAWYRADDPNAVHTDVANEYTRAQNFNATTLEDTATISWNLAQNQVANVTLAGNRTLANPTNMVDGATYILIVNQDSAGSRTLTFDTAYKFEAGVTPVLTSATASVDILTFISDGTSMYGTAQYDFK